MKCNGNRLYNYNIVQGIYYRYLMKLKSVIKGRKCIKFLEFQNIFYMYYDRVHYIYISFSLIWNLTCKANRYFHSYRLCSLFYIIDNCCFEGSNLDDIKCNLRLYFHMKDIILSIIYMYYLIYNTLLHKIYILKLKALYRINIFYHNLKIHIYYPKKFK